MAYESEEEPVTAVTPKEVDCGMVEGIATSKYVAGTVAVKWMPAETDDVPFPTVTATGVA